MFQKGFTTLVEQAMLLRSELHGCLERVEVFLTSAVAALRMSTVSPEASPPVELEVVSSDIGEDGLYGEFSPQAMPSVLPHPHVLAASESKVVAPVMLVMPELEGLCGESTPPLSLMHLEVADSTPPSMEPGQPLVSVDSKALFAKEISDLLVSLETAIPGSSKEITCYC